MNSQHEGGIVLYQTFAFYSETTVCMSKGTAVAVVLLGFNNNFGNIFHTILIVRLETGEVDNDMDSSLDSWAQKMVIRCTKSSSKSASSDISR